MTGDRTYKTKLVGANEGTYIDGGTPGRVTRIKGFWGTGGKCGNHEVITGIEIESDETEHGLSHGTRLFGNPDICDTKDTCEMVLDYSEFVISVYIYHYPYVTGLDFWTNSGALGVHNETSIKVFPIV